MSKLPPHPPHNRPVAMPNRAVWDFWRALDSALSVYRTQREAWRAFGPVSVDGSDDERNGAALTDLARLDGPRLEQLMMDMEAEAQHLMAGADNIRKLLKRVETGVVSPATVAVIDRPEAKA